MIAALSIFMFSIAIMLLLGWWRPRVGWYVLMALLPSYLLRTQVLWIPTTWLELATYALALGLAGNLWWHHQLRTVWQRLNTHYSRAALWLGLWLAAALLATVVSPDLRLSAGALKGWWFDPLLLGLVFTILATDTRIINATVKALLTGATIVSTYGLIEYIGHFGMQADGLLNSFYKPANYVALLIVPICLLAVGQLRARWQTNKGNRYVILAVLALNLLALYLTRSYGGFAALFSGILILTLFVRNPRQRHRVWVAYLIIALLAVGLVATQPKFQKLIHPSSRTDLSTRLQIWDISLQVLKQHPVWGVGLGNFQKPYRDMAFRMFHPPLEWEVVKAHNLYLNTWLEVGLPGLLVFIGLIWQFFLSIARLINAPDLDKTSWWLAAGATAAFIAILVHGLVDTPYFKNDLSLLFVIVWLTPWTLYYNWKKSDISVSRIDKR